MLDRDLKRKWVEALRSGEYDQGQWRLCRVTSGGAKYCCLGVVYEVANGEDAWFSIPSTSELRTGCGEMAAYFPPGLSDADAWALIDLNDSGRSFDEIACWIEENL